jgi:hypothetical protein
MATQEPLFNNTVFRYDLMHDLFTGYEEKNQLITDSTAIYITAALATKGNNYFSCDPSLFHRGI